jgi:hypothetical protein
MATSARPFSALLASNTFCWISASVSSRYVFLNPVLKAYGSAKTIPLLTPTDPAILKYSS